MCTTVLNFTQYPVGRICRAILGVIRAILGVILTNLGVIWTIMGVIRAILRVIQVLGVIRAILRIEHLNVLIIYVDILDNTLWAGVLGRHICIKMRQGALKSFGTLSNHSFVPN